jgi:hypothetical protein
MSAMRSVNADISQKSLISLILFLFFNASLIEKYKALKIKIEVLNFINDINILIYDRIIKLICKTLSKIYDICTKWTWTHDVTFTSKKYKLTHFTWKLYRFDMMINLCIENVVIKSKSDVQVLEVQLNMKLRWNSHLQQIKTDHITRMLTFNHFNVFTWKTIFAKARQMYSVIIRSKLAFEALI